ncbi:hypothetical protein X943_001192 [Babesia divergens]|uniref:Uncharacterized protein n=1 Tax=Babesia divergens TaxID=32595 RepID=A0AAD9LFT1_BABDI|nr:hypothetical protein X943_001192 [Babesia divergens]
MKKQTGVAEQRIMPRTDEQQKHKNLLEGCGGVMLKDILNRSGNVLAFERVKGVRVMEPSLDKA